MTPTGITHAFILGKTTSYRLNAYDDADIADLLIGYVTRGDHPDDDDPITQRARRFIEQAPDVHAHDYLTVQAFTLYHLNGFANLMYARWLEQKARLEPTVHSDRYATYESGPIDLAFWRYLLRRDLEPVRAYARDRASLTLTLDHAAVVAAMCGVQDDNIAANLANRRLLLDGHAATNAKIEMLRRCATQNAYPRVFLRSAANTQAAASRWDRFFAFCLRWRFGVWRR